MTPTPEVETPPQQLTMSSKSHLSASDDSQCHEKVVYELPVGHNGFPVAHNELPAAHNAFPLAHNELPAAYNANPMAHNGLPLTHNAFPLAHNANSVA